MKLSPFMKIVLALTLMACAVVFWRSREDGEQKMLGGKKMASSGTASSTANSQRKKGGANKTTSDSVNGNIGVNTGPNASGIQDFRVAEINLFPHQSWAPPPPPMPAPVITPPVAKTTAPTVPAPLPVMLHAIGEWNYQGEQQIVVLEDSGKFYFLCMQCDVEGRILPKGHFGGHFRFDRLDKTTVRLTDLRNQHTLTIARILNTQPSGNQ
jgi:hypothetical protein